MRRLVFAFLGAFMFKDAMATPAPTVRLPQIIATSNLICAGLVVEMASSGKVTETAGGKSYEIDKMLATVRCVRVHKGSATPGQEVKVEFPNYPEIPLPFPTIAKGNFLLLFLIHSDTQDIFRPANQYRWTEPIREDSGAPPPGNVEAELLNVVLHGKDGDAERAMRSLDEVDDQWANKVSNTDHNPHVDEAVKTNSLAARIRAGEVAALEEAGNLPAFKENHAGWHPSESKIVREIGKVRQSEASPALQSLLKHPNLKLRLSASEALKQIGDARSIPSLIEGLGDADFNVARNCLAGLSRITHRSGPGSKEFRATRSKVVDDWKHWWQEEQGKKK